MTTEPEATGRDELAQQLIWRPFDVVLRARFAELLLAAGDAEAGLTQFELLAEQQPEQGAWHTGAARALLRLGRNGEALGRYGAARALAGFEPVAELEELGSTALPATGPGLRLVPDAGAVVIPIERAPQDHVLFSSIVGMDALKKTIRLKIIEPFVNPGLFQRFRKKAGGGILLYGPPGCGKTMIARAVANECRAEFIPVGISDVLSMWHGESERLLASVFEKARSQAPAVLFFDELDALAYSRSKAQSDHTRTVVNEFLSQLDGVDRDNTSVLILAATNMPWDVDPAMKRPGRFARQIFVPPPDAEARRRMLEIKLAGVPCEALDMNWLAAHTRHFSGADIDGLIELAKEAALEDSLMQGSERKLRQEDFSTALQELQPSTLDWLRTARNLVRYAGADGSFRDVEAWLKSAKLL